MVLWFSVDDFLIPISKVANDALFPLTLVKMVFRLLLALLSQEFSVSRVSSVSFWEENVLPKARLCLR